MFKNTPRGRPHIRPLPPWIQNHVHDGETLPVDEIWQNLLGGYHVFTETRFDILAVECDDFGQGNLAEGHTVSLRLILSEVWLNLLKSFWVITNTRYDLWPSIVTMTLVVGG